MTRGYETTLLSEPGSNRGNANPAYTEDAAHIKDIPAPAFTNTHQDIGEIAIPIASFYTSGKATLSLSVDVEDNALDVFDIRYQYAPDGSYDSVASAALDYSTPNAPVLYSDIVPIAVPVGSSHCSLDVRGVYSVQIWAASGNAAGSKATITGGTEG